MGVFKSLSKRLKLPMPGGTVGKYSTGFKTLGALTFNNPGTLLDPDVLGARGSLKDPGRSVDQAKDKTMLIATEEVANQKAASAAAAAAAEEPFTKAKESQVQALKRKGRRASILTSSQGVDAPLGLPG